jgi:predicted transcriptional regulator
MPKPKSDVLTEAEQRIMRVLWEKGEASVRDVTDALEPTYPVAYNTVLTLLRILTDKDYVVPRQDGRAFIYKPTVSRAEARSRALRMVVCCTNVAETSLTVPNARLVVDTGLHALGWSREQAIQFMLDNTALASHEVTTEVDRYISWPGQALSYYLGEMAIVEARAKAEAALGAKFDIRFFHDTVLQLGSVPLPVLAARIDEWIADGGPDPYADGD